MSFHFQTIFNKVLFCYQKTNGLSSFFWLLYCTIYFSLAVRINWLFSRLVHNQTARPITFIFKSGVSRIIEIRPQDIPIFYEIFFTETYKEALHPILKTNNWVVDLGANIGLTTIYLMEHSSTNLNVICLEPSTKNLRLLHRNLSPYSKAIVIQGMISKQLGYANIKDKLIGYNIKETDIEDQEGTRVKSYNMESLISENSIPKINLLKIDIEGAERELFKGSCDWLEKVERIIIEFHDQPFKRKILNKLTSLGFETSLCNSIESQWLFTFNRRR